MLKSVDSHHPNTLDIRSSHLLSILASASEEARLAFFFGNDAIMVTNLLRLMKKHEHPQGVIVFLSALSTFDPALLTGSEDGREERIQAIACNILLALSEQVILSWTKGEGDECMSHEEGRSIPLRCYCFCAHTCSIAKEIHRLVHIVTKKCFEALKW
jgi:hypothetical protein